VTHVGRQPGQLGLDIEALAVPAQQGLDGKSVPQVMNPRRPAVRRADFRSADEQPKPWLSSLPV
jgi:hypothetical protein